MVLRNFISVLALAPLFTAVSALAADLTLSVELPALNVAEYHKPYVALWIENEKGENTSLAVWYQLEERGQKSEKGEEWLKDMRQWWRRIGRDLEMPVDGVSGATRAPGKHTVTFAEGKAPLGNLKNGNYVLMVEASREVGGRELVKVPFSWPVKSVTNERASGNTELGEIILTITP